jgi:GNAT superfamily N-acetyltransferase
MSSRAPSYYATSRVDESDVRFGFCCGKHPLDDYFRRHAVPNDLSNIGRTYVLRRNACDDALLPPVLGFYTLCMAAVPSAQIAPVVEGKLPRYDMPVALIGRLAVDQRAQRRGLGEKLLIDALRRVVDGAGTFGCVGIVVDAKDEAAEHFYLAYGFTTITDATSLHRMFLALETAREALEG